jgi:hypothetical protein
MSSQSPKPIPFHPGGQAVPRYWFSFATAILAVLVVALAGSGARADSGGQVLFSRTLTLGAGSTARFIIPFQEGSSGGTRLFLLSVKDFEVGDRVGFSSGTALPSGRPISLPMLTITQKNMTLGVRCTIPANFSTEIAVNYWARGITEPGKQMVFEVVAVPESPNPFSPPK